ncbi:hypothetical protein A2982_01480 [candidate division WWE3 bacterium RIFCSPLOWO2_01_FULL_39_13]|uniref:DinB-like domain-containing protein n=1 Tax=candidate division WWE3 bacterium RIFCSPLOWO2_01_FULL_39_13 TaxID=1802624 RepID=A0A1F4V4M2_UNCKA|nr:MAG: hypothetical protein A2982_01480 [candidate division WWE3 bacterium RIFCSPLOWO2_01_FULL_39_13]
MNKLVDDLTQARKSIIDAVSKLTSNKQNVQLAGDWNLKDLIAHLTGWADYQIEIIKAIRSNSTPPEPGRIDDFNQKSTAARKKTSWKKVYDEWLKASQELIEEYDSLRDALWGKPLWKNKKTTLEKLIKIEIRHYQKTHLPQIEKLLKSAEV